MKKQLRSLLDRYFGQFAHRSDIDNLRRQMACIAELQATIPAPIPFGKLGGWAISADALAVVVRDIRSRQAPSIVEFGSGVSTLAIAGLLKTFGKGRLVTIEHDLTYLKVVERDLLACGLNEFVDLRHSGIVDFPGMPPLAACRSYNLSRLDISFDVALVDGPITAEFGAATRMVPLEWCVGRLHCGGSIYLDDARRNEESQLITALHARHPEIAVEFLDAEKGLARLKRLSTDGLDSANSVTHQCQQHSNCCIAKEPTP